MKKPLKLILGVLVLLVLLVAGAVAVVVFRIDSIAKRGVEVAGSRALGVPTTLGSAHVGLMPGSFAMAGLKVDNPPGYDGKFLELGSGYVQVSLDTLRSSTVQLPRLTLDAVSLDIERNSKGSNYKVLLENVKKLTKGDKPANPDEPKKLFKVAEVSITNVTVHLDLLGGPAGLTKLNVPIAEVKLTDVGSDGSGVELSELTAIIIEGLLHAAVAKAGELLPADIANDIIGHLEDIGDLSKVGIAAIGKVGEQIKTLKLDAAAKDVEKGVKDAADAVKKDLKDLVPKLPSGKR